jgi:hypothetical protein
VALAAVGSRALEPAPIDRLDPLRILLLPSILLDVTSKYTRTNLEYSHGQCDVIAEIVRAGTVHSGFDCPFAPIFHECSARVHLSHKN